MELWQEILANILEKQEVKISFPQAPNMEKLFEKECYKALKRISEIIKNKDVDDEECFMRIEAIICELEKIGSSGGSRHDF